jgi:preprotein translocase subunit SecE
VTQTRGATALPDGDPERAQAGKAAERGSVPARISLYYRQVVAELRKVIWPTRRELVTYTTVVIVFVLVIIAFVSVLDLGFGQLVFWVFG